MTAWPHYTTVNKKNQRFDLLWRLKSKTQASAKLLKCTDTFDLTYSHCKRHASFVLFPINNLSIVTLKLCCGAVAAVYLILCTAQLAHHSTNTAG